MAVDTVINTNRRDGTLSLNEVVYIRRGLVDFYRLAEELASRGATPLAEVRD